MVVFCCMTIDIRRIIFVTSVPEYCRI